MRARPLLVAFVGVVAASAIGVLAFRLLGNGDERATEGPIGVAETQTGFLVVDQKLFGGLFTEGAFTYVRLESAEGEVVAERLLRDTRSVLPLLRRRLAVGAYRLVSYQRPCDGACPGRGTRGLDPPTLKCEATVEISAGEMIAALARPRVGRGCRVSIGERVGPVFARREGLAACRGVADNRDHDLRYWATNWGAASTQPRDLGAAYGETAFRGFEPSIRAAAAEGCTEGIRTVQQPIRLVLEGRLAVGETVEVSITNVGTRAYLFEAYYQACFLFYFDSSGRRFIVPPGTHCDLRGKVAIRPGDKTTLQAGPGRVREGPVGLRPQPPAAARHVHDQGTV